MRLFEKAFFLLTMNYLWCIMLYKPKRKGGIKMVFNILKRGQLMPMTQLMAHLISFMQGDPNAKNKAAASIGGSVRHGRIIPVFINGILHYVRVM